jgi:hypothetical protein
MGAMVSTPRDYGNTPGGQRPGDPSSGRVPTPRPGSPQQGGTPWYQQPPQRGNQVSGPMPAAPQQWQPSPPGPWGPTAAAAPAAPAKSGGSGLKIFLIGAAVVAVLAIGVIAAVLLPAVFHHETKKIPIATVQTQVQQVLLDRITGYSAGDISNVKCNNGQEVTVKKGGSFNCDVTVRGKQHQLTVTFPDETGTYEVGIPQLSGGK